MQQHVTPSKHIYYGYFVHLIVNLTTVETGLKVGTSVSLQMRQWQQVCTWMAAIERAAACGMAVVDRFEGLE